MAVSITPSLSYTVLSNACLDIFPDNTLVQFANRASRGVTALQEQNQVVYVALETIFLGSKPPTPPPPSLAHHHQHNGSLIHVRLEELHPYPTTCGSRLNRILWTGHLSTFKHVSDTSCHYEVGHNRLQFMRCRAGALRQFHLSLLDGVGHPWQLPAGQPTVIQLKVLCPDPANNRYTMLSSSSHQQQQLLPTALMFNSRDQLDLFPQNTDADFTAQLAHPLPMQLTAAATPAPGQWRSGVRDFVPDSSSSSSRGGWGRGAGPVEMALTSLYLPGQVEMDPSSLWLTIYMKFDTTDNNIVTTDGNNRPSFKKTTLVPQGCDEAAINTMLGDSVLPFTMRQQHSAWEFDMGHMARVRQVSQATYVFSPVLAYLMGLQDTAVASKSIQLWSSHMPDLVHTVPGISTFPAAHRHVLQPQLLFIYCDCIKSSGMGDGEYPLLRMVALDYTPWQLQPHHHQRRQKRSADNNTILSGDAMPGVIFGRKPATTKTADGGDRKQQQEKSAVAPRSITDDNDNDVVIDLQEQQQQKIASDVSTTTTNVVRSSTNHFYIFENLMWHPIIVSDLYRLHFTIRDAGGNLVRLSSHTTPSSGVLLRLALRQS